MKTLALAALAVLCFSTFSAPAFAVEKHSVPAEPTDPGRSPIPEVGGLPSTLQMAVLWAYFLTQNPDCSVLDLSRGVRFVEAQMKRYAK